MDAFFHYDTFSSWILQYGSLALFLLLASGVIIFPIPEETLMVFAGILMSNGKLQITPTIIAGIAGSLTGITLSYLIGRKVGSSVVHRYGKWVGIDAYKMQMAHEWFGKYGKWTLFIGYFIPGVRHLTGIVAGITQLEARQFVQYAYPGGIFWVSTCLSVGYFLGDFAFQLFERFKHVEFEIEWFAFVALLTAIITITWLIIARLKKNT